MEVFEDAFLEFYPKASDSSKSQVQDLGIAILEVLLDGDADSDPTTSTEIALYFYEIFFSTSLCRDRESNSGQNREPLFQETLIQDTLLTELPQHQIVFLSSLEWP